MLEEINFSNKKNLKNFIIFLLAKEFSLTAKEIFKKATFEGYCVSYQAVFKALLELTNNKILIKKEKNYELNKRWIEYLKYLINLVRNNSQSRVMDFNYPESIKRFLNEIGPKIERYLGEDGGCVIVPKYKTAFLTPGEFLGQTLSTYLINKNKKISYLPINPNKISFDKDNLQHRKVIIVDVRVIAGKSMIKIEKAIKKIKRKYHILGLKKAAIYDWTGITDWSLKEHSVIDFLGED